MATKRKDHQVLDWKPVFLKHFRRHGCLSRAAKSAKVERSTVYRATETDADFLEAFTDAEAEASDHLEEELYDRAVKGRKKLVVSGGKVVEYKDKPVYTTIVSDYLLVRLLEARNPGRWVRNAPGAGGLETPYKVLEGVTESKVWDDTRGASASSSSIDGTATGNT